MQHLFLCTEPRTGSNLFLQLLENTSGPHPFASLNEALYNPRNLYQNQQLLALLGEHVEEFCLLDRDHRYNAAFNLELYRTILPAYAQQHGHPRPVAIKWFSLGIRYLLKYLNQPQDQDGIPSPAIRHRFNDLFGSITWVHLYRKDVWRQAISYYFALKSDHWVSFKQPSFEICEDTLPFDFAELETLYQSLQEKQAWWQRFFDKTGFQPAMSISYEELTSDYGRILNQLGSVLDTEIHVPSLDLIRHQKQVHPLKEVYYQRILETLKSKRKQSFDQSER
jgi:LPS sulfotransferase NodH